MKIKNYAYAAIVGGFAATFVGCDKNDDLTKAPIETPDSGDDVDRKYFNLVVGIDVESSNSSTYTAAYTDLSSKDMNISFNGWGYEVPSVRTARVYASNAGDFLYNLSYGGGTISKYKVEGGQVYSPIKTLDISVAIGTANPRWTKLNDEYASLHHVVTEVREENGKYSFVNAECILTAIDLKNFSIIGASETSTGGVTFDFPRSSEDVNENLHVWRIDAPVIANGKAYYGLNKRSYNAETAENVSTSDYSASSLVVDFPSLDNPKIITSTVGKGSTQGYRTPVAHADENNDVYQICAAPTKIMKISNGDYDNTYSFDLSQALGVTVGSNGWFYVGDGIGYMPYYDADKGNGSDVAAWGVARIDLYNKTAIRMNLPENLWLQQYQYGVIGNDGLFYMAIAPLGGNGNIYMFDPSNATADGFTVGASIQTINSTSAYLGIF